MKELATITNLALVDSINPCTLAVQLLLLSSLLATRGRESVLVGGILFSLTIMLMYFLYGIGILQIFYILGIDEILRIILKALLLILAFLEIYAFINYKPGLRSVEMPMRLRPIAKKLLSSVENPLIAIPAAILCSVLLLPCSSGPYVLMLMIIKTYGIVSQFLWLLYYNILFILPMIAITFIVYFGTKPEKIIKWREKHIRELHLISGILLLIVFVMV